MNTLKIIAYVVIALYGTAGILLFIFQARLLFYPGKLAQNFKFRTSPGTEELFLKTSDGESINALYYPGAGGETILYFHGNAGDLSGWKFMVDTFAAHGYGVLIIDYRGYGKSTGTISEEGFYEDAQTAYRFLTQVKKIAANDIVLYGRSIGSGVAVELASRNAAKALVLESPYTSLKTLANEKLPFFFPSLYLRFHFNTLKKIKTIAMPVVLIHGQRDELIPAHHSEALYPAIATPKKMILIAGGGHNDLGDFAEYQEFLKEGLAAFLDAH